MLTAAAEHFGTQAGTEINQLAAAHISCCSPNHVQSFVGPQFIPACRHRKRKKQPQPTVTVQDDIRMTLSGQATHLNLTGFSLDTTGNLQLAVLHAFYSNIHCQVNDDITKACTSNTIGCQPSMINNAFDQEI